MAFGHYVAICKKYPAVDDHLKLHFIDESGLGRIWYPFFSTIFPSIQISLLWPQCDPSLFRCLAAYFETCLSVQLHDKFTSCVQQWNQVHGMFLNPSYLLYCYFIFSVKLQCRRKVKSYLHLHLSLCCCCHPFSS